MSSVPIVLVESKAALTFARTRFSRARWATMSPFVTELLKRDGEPCIVIDLLIDREDADKIGYMAIDAAKEIAATIDSENETRDGLKPGSAMIFELHRGITCFLYKAMLLERLRAHAGPRTSIYIVGSTKLTPVSGLSIQPGRFDTVFAALGQAVGAEIIPFETPEPRSSMSNGDFLRATWWTRLITFLNAPAPSVFYRVFGRVARRKARRFWPSDSKLVCGVLSDNELIEETVLALARRGVRLLRLPAFPIHRSELGRNVDPLSHPESFAEPIIEGLANSGLQSSGTIAAANVVGRRIHTALAYAGSIMSQARDYGSEIESISRRNEFALLSNAISGPAMHLLVQHVRKLGIPVYVFEHGTGPGLDQNHDAVYRSGLAPIVDRAVYYNSQQRAVGNAARVPEASSDLISGAPKILRSIGARPVQRMIARLAAKSGGGRAIAWVTGLYPNNMPFLPHYYRDGSYHELRCDVVNNVLAHLPDRVLLKLYPTMRHVDPDPFAGLMELPKNCSVVHLVDFRNLRAGVDVVLIDEPGSALAWCWGAELPFIYIDTEMRLNESTSSSMKRAAFYIDAAVPGWQQALRNLLELPHEELLELWRAKARDRHQVSLEMMLGPDGNPGARAADYIVADMLLENRNFGSQNQGSLAAE